FFPERLRLTKATLIVRNRPDDFVAEGVDLDLDPRHPGDLLIETLQLPAGDRWSRVSGQTSYTNKNLILRDLILSDQEQLRLLNIDASHIDADALTLNLNCIIGGGQLSASAALTETKSALNAKINVAAQKLASESLNKFLVLPGTYLSGEIERLALDGAGVIDSPRTWSGRMSLQTSNVDRPGIHFDRGVVEISAEQGRAILRSADIIQDVNNFHFRGAMELPSSFNDFGRTPSNFEISGTAPSLERLAAGTPVGLTGSARFTGRIDIANANVQATLGVTGEAIGFQDGIVDKLNWTLRRFKLVVGGVTKRGWLAGSNLSMRDLVFRQVSAQCSISNNIIYLNDLSALLNDTDYVNATGRFNLRRPYHYSGRVSANVANLSTLQPLFHASGNQNQLAGSTTLDWEGNGDAQTFNNSGKLKFVLQKARYGNLQSLQANVDASYLPDGLDVPIIFFATSGMDFRAIAQAKGDKLEIDKIELNQVVKPQPQATRRSGAR